ncbi:unknown [Clostridium sp. CAG:492]|nr:unknown [Clostridium sp. CAG:492]
MNKWNICRNFLKVFMIILESEVNIEQHNNYKRKSNKYITKRIDNKSDTKRKID